MARIGITPGSRNHGETDLSYGGRRQREKEQDSMAIAEAIRVCLRCGIRYDWRRSPSASLKMTYCGTLCEKSDLGFTIDSLLRSAPRRPTPGLAIG